MLEDAIVLTEPQVVMMEHQLKEDLLCLDAPLAWCSPPGFLAAPVVPDLAITKLGLIVVEIVVVSVLKADRNRAHTLPLTSLLQLPYPEQPC